jgi:hypothetical protein
MRATWLALAVILATSLLGAYVLGRALEKAKPTQSLIPRGARVLGKRTLSDDQRVIRWQLGDHAKDPVSGLYGVTVVEGRIRLYSHRASRHDRGLSVETGDFSGDGRKDVLTFEDLGGSGGCGTYRAIVTGPGTARQVRIRDLCEDLGSIHIRHGGLLTAIGLQKDPTTPLSPHCCYLRVRRTLERWNGARWARISTTTRPAPRSWPPGGVAPGRAA